MLGLPRDTPISRQHIIMGGALRQVGIAQKLKMGRQSLPITISQGGGQDFDRQPV